MNLNKRFANEGDICYNVIEEKYYRLSPKKKSSSSEESIESEEKEELESDEEDVSSHTKAVKKIKKKCLEKLYGKIEAKRMIGERKKVLPPEKKSLMFKEAEYGAVPIRLESQSGSDQGSEWEAYLDYICTAYTDEPLPDEVKQLAKYDPKFIDEEIPDPDGIKKRTIRQEIRKKLKIKKKRRTAVRSEHRLYNLGFPCGWQEDDKDDPYHFDEPSSTTVTPRVRHFFDEKKPVKDMKVSKQIERGEELINRLMRNKGVKYVIILINGAVLATNMADRSLLGYYIRYFYFLSEAQLIKFRDLDPTDSLEAIEIETRMYDLIIGIGYEPQADRDSDYFTIMVFQYNNKDLTRTETFNPGFTKLDRVEFPKVWLKGLERRPESPHSIHERKYKETLGLEKSDAVDYAEDEVTPYLRTGHSFYDPNWRHPLRSPSPEFKAEIDQASIIRNMLDEERVFGPCKNDESD